MLNRLGAFTPLDDLVMLSSRLFSLSSLSLSLLPTVAEYSFTADHHAPYAGLVAPYRIRSCSREALKKMLSTPPQMTKSLNQARNIEIAEHS